MAAKLFIFLYSVQGVGGRRQGGYRGGAPYKKMGKKKKEKNSVQGVGGRWRGGGVYGGGPLYKNGGKKRRRKKGSNIGEIGF